MGVTESHGHGHSDVKNRNKHYSFMISVAQQLDPKLNWAIQAV